MNILQRLGNNWEKIENKNKRFKEKYWKLSSQERMEYDDKSEKLIPGFDLLITRLVSLVSLLFVGFIFLLAFAVNYNFNELLELVRPIAIEYIKLIPILIVSDLLIYILLIFISDKKLKELNKRFKL